MEKQSRHSGFTLIQLSILLVVASLVLVTILPSSQSRLTLDRNSTATLNTVLNSVRQYQVKNGYIPCPADASQPIGSASYGVPAANGGASGNCAGGTPSANYIDSANNIAVGMVPVRALGLTNNYALDGYGRDITYAVDTNATACWTNTSMTGQIAVTDNGTSYTTIAALVSHGLDGHGAWIPLTGTTGSAVRFNAGSTDTDQLTNAHVNSSFVPVTPLNNFVRKSPTSTFDDLVVYKSNLWTLNNAPASLPNITSVTAPVNGTYTSGQTLSFTVNYSTAVTVTTTGGTPYLSLSAITGNVGTGNLAKATYQSGSGSTALVFSYTIGATDTAPTGLAMTSSITLNGGSIASGSTCAGLGLTAPNLTLVIIGSKFLYAADENNNRVQILSTSGTYIGQFPCGSGACSASSDAGQLDGPKWGIATDPSGNIWVLNAASYTAYKYTSTGAYTGTSIQPQRLDHSGWQTVGCGIATDSSGNVWISDCAVGVVEYDSNGNYKAQLCYNSFNTNALNAGACPSASNQNGYMTTPKSLAFDASGNLWVVDYDNWRVEEFNVTTTLNSGTPWMQSIVLGNSSNNYDISDMAFDSGGNVWLPSLYSGSMMVYSISGTTSSLLKAFYPYWNSGAGYTTLSFVNKFGSVLIDPNTGYIWLGDPDKNALEVMTSNGTQIAIYGTQGSGNLQFQSNYDAIMMSLR